MTTLSFLPTLPGRRTARRWAIALAIAIAALALLQVVGEHQRAARRIGVAFEDHPDGGLRVVAVTAGSPAARVGLTADDRLLSLQGQPLRERGDYDRALEAAPRGAELIFELSRGDLPLRVVVQPGMPADRVGILLAGLVVLAYLALGLIAVLRAEDDGRAILLALFAFAVALELALPSGEDVGGVWSMVASAAFRILTGIQFSLELHLAAMIPTPLPALQRNRRPLVALYVCGLGVGLLSAGALLAAEAGMAGADRLSSIFDAVLIDWMLPIWALFVVVLIGWRAHHHRDPRGRHQAWLVVLGLTPWVGVVLYLAIAQLAGVEASVPDLVWSLALLAYPLAIFAAIFLYRLFDLELVIRRTVVYGTLTTLLVLGFYGLVGAGGALFARRLDGPAAPIWVISAATLVLGLLVHPLRLRLERLIGHSIFPERQALRSRLVGLAAELPAQGKLPRMAEHLAQELSRIFAVEPVSVWITVAPHGQLVEHASTGRSLVDAEPTALIAADDPAIRRIARGGRPVPASVLSEGSPALAARLVGSGAEFAVPLVAQDRLVGLLLVGAKRDRTRFGAEEVELLALLGHHVATVFENARLFESATYEGLTGLYRREAILEILDREWNRAHRYDRPLAIAIADLDRFKVVNDRYGHLGGDLVLQRVAAELQGQLRETDFIGRFGGEEFLIVLPETTLDGARAVAEKARRRIEQLDVHLEQGEALRITLSFGVASRAELQGEPRLRARALIGIADEALYAAKRAGRNRVEVAAAAR